LLKNDVNELLFVKTDSAVLTDALGCIGARIRRRSVFEPGSKSLRNAIAIASNEPRTKTIPEGSNFFIKT